MTQGFAFGNLAVYVSGPERLMSCLPGGFAQYQSDIAQFDRSVSIILKEGSPQAAPDAGNGWTAKMHDGSVSAAYNQDGRVLFTLSYGPAHNGTVVTISGQDRGNVGVGVQFAMLTAGAGRVLGLHGVTLLCGDEIIILSAPSGTGKTTLSRLLESYQDAIVLNGDFAMLSCPDDTVWFEPTPFCGTSGRCLNQRAPVDRVVFLEQSRDDRWQRLNGRQALSRFMSNTFVPLWDERLVQSTGLLAARCLASLSADLFSFAPHREASEIFLTQLMCEKCSLTGNKKER